MRIIIGFLLGLIFAGLIISGYFIFFSEKIIEREAAEMIVSEQEIKTYLGSNWSYAGEKIGTLELGTSLSEFGSDFHTPYVSLNYTDSVRSKLTLEIHIVVFKSIKDAKKYYNDDREVSTGQDYISKEINVGEEGFSSEWLKGIPYLPLKNYFFRKKNVYVTMSYSHAVSGNEKEIDRDYLETNDVFGDFGLDGINDLRLAQLQASKIIKKV